jgi:hypothetical protein
MIVAWTIPLCLNIVILELALIVILAPYVAGALAMQNSSRSELRLAL